MQGQHSVGTVLLLAQKNIIQKMFWLKGTVKEYTEQAVYKRQGSGPLINTPKNTQHKNYISDVFYDHACLPNGTIFYFAPFWLIGQQTCPYTMLSFYKAAKSDERSALILIG